MIKLRNKKYKEQGDKQRRARGQLKDSKKTFKAEQEYNQKQLGYNQMKAIG